MTNNRSRAPQSKNKEMQAEENRQGMKFYMWNDKSYVLTPSTVPELKKDLIPSGKKIRKEK